MIQTKGALKLLKLHNGRCSCDRRSPLISEFLQLEAEGKITLTPSSTPGIYDADDGTFQPRYEASEENV